MAIVESALVANRRLLRLAADRPALLILAFFGYGFTNLFVGICLASIAQLIADVVSDRSQAAQASFILSFLGAFGLLSLIIWSHFLYLAYETYKAGFSIIGDVGAILQYLQLIASTAFTFAVLHYYVALLSTTPAYAGMRLPTPPNGWHPAQGALDRLIFVPEKETLIDCIYFSAVTVATVGFGDIHPITSTSKIVTTIEIMCSFVMVIVVLGRVISRFSEDQRRSNPSLPPAGAASAGERER